VDIVLSAEQKALLKIMEETKEHIFITGKAGAGKSVLLRHFREQTKKRIAVAAPTGIAALNVKAQTIHSLFKLGIGLQEPESLRANERLDTLLSRIETLVIDEISMVRADIMDAIDARFRTAKKKKDVAFGGTQIIMFGDPFQLPPVVEKNLVQYFEDTYGGHFFFNAKVWKSATFKIFELSQVFRQKDPAFRDILNAVRNGTASAEQVEQLNSRHGEVDPEDGTITLAPTNELVSRINQENLARLSGKVKEYKATITGDMKRGIFPTEEYLQLKVGAQIVLLKNDKDGRWVNGTVGKVEAFHEDHIDIRVDGQVSRLERESWEEVIYEYDAGEGKVKATVGSSFTQYPIKLAWGLTVHKSQGQTYERVQLDLSTGVFAAGQLYVALSRCTSLEGLWLKRPVKHEYIIVDSKVVEFMSRCEAIVVEEESVAVEEQPGEVVVQALAEALAIVEEVQEAAEALHEEVSDESIAIIDQALELSAAALPDEASGIEQSLMVMASASVESVTVEPVDGGTVERSNGLTVEIVEEAGSVIIEEIAPDQVPLTEGRVARIAAIEVLCPACAGICVDPGTGSTYITPDLVGHTIVCSRCKQQCIVPLNAFSLDGAVIAREKPEQNVSNAKREKKGRTKKERKSNAGAKSHGKEPKQPLQLSLDMRIIQTLKTWGVNASALYKELLAQYDPFLQQYREVTGEEFGEEESDEEEDE
jgi:ATP-dependent DNA helicase PIF1